MLIREKKSRAYENVIVYRKQLKQKFGKLNAYKNLEI